MPGTRITLDEALDLSRTGDVWLFRGRTPADRAIQLTTNSPVNHVGMSVVIEDLPPLMWHAELGRSVSDVWSGTHQRGAQLHDLREAVVVWAARYGQRAWLRQLDHPVTREMEDAVLRTIARLDGTPSLIDPFATVEVQHRGRKARFRVIWVGGYGSEQHAQAGLLCLDSKRCIWGQPLPGKPVRSSISSTR